MVTLMPSLAACRAEAAPAMPQPTTRRSVSNAAAGLHSIRQHINNMFAQDDATKQQGEGKSELR